MPNRRMLVALALSLAVASPQAVRGQRAHPAVRPLATAPAAGRIPLPDVLAVRPDSTFQLVIPALYERRAIFRLAGGEWTLVESAFARDSARAQSAVVGRAVGLYAEGQPAGAGRIRAVRAGLCAEPPAWCPPAAVLETIGSPAETSAPLVAVSPPPSRAAETVDPTDDEVAAASSALLTVLQAGAGPRARVREDQMGAPAVFAVNDSTAHRRIVVAAVSVPSGAGTLSGLVVGVPSETQLANATGRTSRLATGASEELRLVNGLDLDGNGQFELLLGWVASGAWRFEILAADRLGRWAVHWTGPDRSMPPAGPRARR